MRETGRPAEGLTPRAGIGSYAVHACEPGLSGPETVSPYPQSEITSPAYAQDVTDADAAAGPFWTPQSPEGGAPDRADYTDRPQRAYASGQIRDLLREASALLTKQGVDIKGLLHKPQARLVDDLLSDAPNEAVAAAWQVKDSGRVSRVGRAILNRLEQHPQSSELFPEGMFEPQGAVVDRAQDPSSFGARLRELREISGLTQAEAAAASGMSLSTYIRMELSQTHPPLPSADAVLQTVGADPGTHAAMLRDFNAERQAARPDQAGKPVPPSARRASHSRETFAALAAAGYDVGSLVKRSTLPASTRYNLQAAFENGLLDPEVTLADVAKASDMSTTTLARAMRSVVEYAGTQPELAPLIPPADPSPAEAERRAESVGSLLDTRRGSMTMREVAARAGISLSSYTRLATGQTQPVPAVINRITKVLEEAGCITPDEAGGYRTAYAAQYAADTKSRQTDTE